MINKTNNYPVITDCEPGAGAAAEGKHLGSRGASDEDSTYLGVGPGWGCRG